MPVTYATHPLAAAVTIFANNDDAHRTARDLAAAGVRIAALIDVREDVPTTADWPVHAGARVIDTKGRLGLSETTVMTASGKEEKIETDLLAVSGGWNPVVHLACHMNGRPVWRDDIAAFVPKSGMVPGLEAAGAANGAMSTSAALAEGGGAAGRKRFVSDIASIPGKAPLRLAGEWESWLKGKDSLAAGFDMNTLVGWMQRWVADLASLRLGGPVRFFPAEHDILHGLAGRMTIDSALGCYNEINQTRRVAQHPLNARLFLEDMLLRYARGFARAAAPVVRK